MKRNIIISACVLVLAFAVGLTGFTLARPDAAENPEQDRLIGVFITTEYLDLFDSEAYFNDNIGKTTGGEISMDGDSARYQGRLYATLTNKSQTSEDDGESVTTQDYVFDGVKGFSYFCYTTANETGTCSISSGDEAISDGHTDISVTDKGENIALDGTIYVAPTGGYVTYYINPVYQSGDGKVYAVTGNGISFNGDSGTYSHTLDASTTVTENGKASTDSTSVKISISIMNPPQRISVLQFGSDGEVLSRDEYIPGAMPEIITPEKGCSYIILETYETSAEQGETVSRTLYQPEDDTLESYYCREDGVCVKQYTTLNWIS